MSKLHSLLILSFLLLSTLSLSLSSQPDNDDEDLSFLDDDDDTDIDTAASSNSDYNFDDNDNDDTNDDFQDEDFEDFDESQLDHSTQEDHSELDFSDPDVVVLKDSNFSDFVESNKYVMVEFYAPWCGHCQALAPEYGAAAEELKRENVSVVLAKVDGTEEEDLAREFEVEGFPSVFWVVDGERVAYNGGRTKDAIVSWIKKKIGPGLSNITTLDEAEHILTSEHKVVLGYLDSLVGPASDELAAASKLDDDVNFYQTVNPDVAKLFHIDPEVKRPAVVLIKREAEKINIYDGQFTKREIMKFISANKLPLVIKFTRESASSIFESSIKKQLLLFASSKDLEKVIPTYEEAAKLFKGKLIFVHVDTDDEENGRPVADYFGITGDAPQVVGFTGNEDSQKFVLDKEITLENIKAFGEDFVEDKLKPFYKSDPVPEKNDGDVKIVVGNNFDEIVLDESKDVLLEIYAPWCGHCQSLEPTYTKLAKHLRDIDSLVIAKMDGTTNEHPRAKAEGFPTLLFFPAGKKTSDPIPVDTDRTVKALYKFLRKNASTPFKLEKTTSASKSEKDEL